MTASRGGGTWFTMLMVDVATGMGARSRHCWGRADARTMLFVGTGKDTPGAACMGTW